MNLFAKSRFRPRLTLGTAWLGLLGSAMLAGCSGGPDRVPAPSWDPEEITARAFELLDTNGDATIDLEEVKASPGLAAAFKRIDRDSNSQLTAAEIQERIALYEKLRTGLVSKTFQAVINGQFLQGAYLEFVPEEFLGGVTSPASGVSDEAGTVAPQTEGQPIPAMQIGFYRVLAHAGPTADTPLLELRESIGVEVSPVAEADEVGTPVLWLTKK